MYKIDWQEVDAEEVPRMIAEIRQKVPDLPFDETASARKHDLPFYAEFYLLEFFEDGNDDKDPFKALYAPGLGVFPLNWTNMPIYTVNEKAPIVLSRELAPTYVKFFFDYVRGRHGRFLIVENADEINWKEEPPAKGKEALNRMISDVSIFDEKDDGTLSMQAYMVFKDSLFKANVHVEKTGLVSLSDEQLVVEGMPIHEDPAPEDFFANP